MAAPPASATISGPDLRVVASTPGRRAASVSGPRLGFRIVNAGSGKCLTVTGGRVSDDSIVIQRTCGDDPSSLWRIRPVLLTGSVRLSNVRSGKCLTIAGDQVADNAMAVLGPCDSSPARRWVVRRPGGGPFTRARLQNAHSHKCLTIAAGTDAENAVAVQYPCDTEPSRRWTAHPAADWT